MPSATAKTRILRYAKDVLLPLLDAPGSYLGRRWSGATLILYLTTSSYDALRAAPDAHLAFNKVATYFALGVVSGEDVVVRVAEPGVRQARDPAFLAAIRD